MSSSREMDGNVPNYYNLFFTIISNKDFIQVEPFLYVPYTIEYPIYIPLK